MNKRYLIAFVTATFVYGVSFMGYSYAMNSFESSQKQQQNAKLNSVVKIALYTPPVVEPIKHQEEVKKVVKETCKIEPKKEIVVKKEAPKKIIEKKIEPEKKVVVKKEIPQKIEKTTPRQEQKVAQIVQQATTQIVAKKEIKNIVTPIDTQKSVEEKNKYLAQVKNIIENNKFYPLSAKRRGIESNIPIRFTILQDGTINQLEILGGKKIFHKSVKETLKSSFPIDPKGVLKEAIEVSLVLKYNLI